MNRESAARSRDLTRLDFVQIAAPDDSPITATRLLARRAIRRWVQPWAGRPMLGAFRELDVTYPGFGTPIPGIPQMQWIPDFQHVHLPHLFSRDARRERDERFASIAGRSGIVILSSEAALNDFVTLYPDAAATPRVWRFCTTLEPHERDGPDPRPVFRLPDSYLYVANQFWAHKEHLTLFKALVLLRDRGVRPFVACSGVMEDARDPGHVPSLLRFLKEHDLDDQVALLGFLDRADQIAVLRYSAAVVQPSRFEGWSTVLEDARAIGRPVIASDIAVHLEQVPDARFFAVGSAESLADVLEQSLTELQPGPDPRAEEAAAKWSVHRRRELGEDFVAIARAALALRRSG